MIHRSRSTSEARALRRQEFKQLYPLAVLRPLLLTPFNYAKLQTAIKRDAPGRELIVYPLERICLTLLSKMVIGGALGRSPTFQPISIEEFRRKLEAGFPVSADFNLNIPHGYPEFREVDSGQQIVVPIEENGTSSSFRERLAMNKTLSGISGVHVRPSHKKPLLPLGCFPNRDASDTVLNSVAEALASRLEFGKLVVENVSGSPAQNQ